MDMENIVQQSVASLVLKNHQIVPVLEKYNIDFCCKGKLSLQEACRDKGIDVLDILTEMESVQKDAGGRSMPFVEMSQAQLVNHIIVHHHYYVRKAMPVIMGQLEKIAAKHGEHYPYMIKVKELFGIIQNEMDQHMRKEEVVLFPRIVEVERELGIDPNLQIPKDYLSGPISMMENEHDQAGDIMFQIRALTNNYKVPSGACTTFQVCLAGLSEFENDLHQYVHLENNILFPRVLESTSIK